MAANKLADYLLENPLYGYGQQVLQSGSSTAPVQSPLEGLARALTGGVGGFFQGQALRQAKGEQQLDQTALADAMTKYGTDPTAARAILASRPNLSDVATTLLVNDVSAQRQKEMLDYKDKLDREGQTRDMQMFGLAPGASVPAAPVATAGASKATGDPSAFIAGRIKRGDDPQTAAAWAANAHNESSFNPAAFNPKDPNGGSIGYIQWNGPRAEGLKKLAASRGVSVTDPEVQHDFLQSEIDANPQFKAALAAAPTAQAKAALISTQFIRPAGGQGEANARAQIAAQYVPQSGGAPAQGATPQVAPGQPTPQQGLNSQPSADTINFQGIPLPRASIAAAMAIRDPKERQGKLTDIVRDAVKQQQGPDAGTTAGDVHILEQVRANPALASQPAYQAAYNRVGEPKMSQNGQLLRPDMSAYPKPIGEQGQTQPKPQMEETPQSRFQMEGKLRDDFNALPPVKNYREIIPMVTSIQDAAKRDNKVADLNMVYGLAKLFDPTGSVREGDTHQVYASQSVPDWLKGYLHSLTGGSGFTAEQRQRIVTEAESRAALLKQQHDAYVGMYETTAKGYGLNPENIVNRPLMGPAGSQGAAPAESAPVRIDINGKPL